MRILVAAGKDILADYLRNAGHETKSLYVNDMAVEVSQKYGAEVVVYLSTVTEIEPHKDVVKALKDAGYRVVLGAGNNDPLIVYAAALGVTDIMLYPLDPADVLFRLNNPATPADAAVLVQGYVSQMNSTTQNTTDAPDFRRGQEREVNGESGGENEKPSRGQVEIGGGRVYADINEKIEKAVSELNKTIPVSSRARPKMVMGIGDTRIEEWIRTNFLDVEVMASSVDPEELKKTIKEISPDICIFMRQSLKGGVPEADDLVVWAADYVPAILFLVGELDDEGKEMAIRAREAGVRNIITCEIGGEIYGDEFVFVLKNIIREVQGGRHGRGKNNSPINIEPGLTKSLFLRGAGILGKAVKQTAETASEKVKSSAVKKPIKPKINKNEGISLDEEPEQTVAFQNLNNPTAIVPGGILAVVSPWRPGLAGRLAAQAVKIFSQGKGVEVAYIGASGSSTGALWLDLPEDVLMMSDWRVPGSNYPIALENLRIYAVDPVKNLSPEIQGELWNLLKDARKTATYTVMDFAGDIANAQKAAHQGRSVLLVILPGNDPVELKISSHWMKNIMDGKQNVVTGIDLRGVPHSIPEGMKPKIIVRNNPADALTIALSKNINEEFIWN